MARGHHQTSKASGKAASKTPKPAVMTQQQQQQQQPTQQQGEERDAVLVLHLIRILALYLVVHLSRSASLALDDLSALFGPASTPETDAEAAAGQMLDALLVSWVEQQTASNQFDGLLPEHRAFLVMKKFFRQHARVPQLRVLAALLSTYLSQLQAPLVVCGSTDMLRSTLEYLLTTGKILQAVSPALLYPLVNAVDSLSIEQRDCLEALTALLQWLHECCDSSEMVLTKFVGRHHRKVIYVTNDDANSLNDNSRTPPQPTPKDAAHLQALGICFVKTLLCHSDHIFRRDPEFVDPPALLDSETEDEDFSEHSPSASPAGAPHKELIGQQEPQLLSPSSSSPTTDSPLSSAETEDADDECHEAPTAPVAAAETRHGGKSSASRSIRKRKKREHKAAAAPGSARCQSSSPPAASPIVPDVTCSAAAAASATVSGVGDADESYATMAIAAAAGTLAAVLCVIFT